MSLISRLFDPDTGSVSIDGVDLRDLDLESLRANVSVALQENVLFGLSLRDNIRYALPEATDAQLMEAVKVACVEEYIASLPEGLDTVLSDRGGKLSTGQRQRLSIARALVKGAPILVLDEPTAALDAVTEHRVLQRLTEWGAEASGISDYASHIHYSTSGHYLVYRPRQTARAGFAYPTHVDR